MSILNTTNRGAHRGYETFVNIWLAVSYGGARKLDFSPCKMELRSDLTGFSGNREPETPASRLDQPQGI